MINIATTFILGAGASMPYGFPSGEGLRRIICDGAQYNNRTSLSHKLEAACGIDPGTCLEFSKAFLLSGQPSVDAFLAKRPEWSPVGKLAIAACLIEQETPLAIANLANEDDWHGALWSALTDGISTPEDLAKNRIRIATFNYDRSLEYSLCEKAMNTFALSEADAQGAIERLPIKHVYGQLGRFSFGQANYDSPFRAYSPEMSDKSLRLAADGIKVIPEARQDEPIFEEIRKWISTSERVCFLGFGFDKLNVHRLGISRTFENLKRVSRPIPSMFASTLGKTEAEVQSISEWLGSSDGKWFPLPYKNLMMLRHTRLLG